MFKKFLAFLLAAVVCSSVVLHNFKNTYAVVGVDDAAIAGSIALGAAAGLAVDYIIKSIARHYVASSGADSTSVDALVDGFKSYIEQNGVIQQVNAYVNNPIYWTVFTVGSVALGNYQKRLRFSADSALYSLLFSAFSDYVATVADDSGVAHVSFASSASGDSDLYGSVSSITAVRDLLNEYSLASRPSFGGNFYHPSLDSMFNSYSDGQIYYYCGFFDYNDNFVLGVLNSDKDVVLGSGFLNGAGFHGYSYPLDGLLSWSTVWVAYSSDPDALLSSDDVTDVPLDRDFLTDLSGVFDNFLDRFKTSYNVYNPTGVISNTDGVAVDIPLETDANGDLVLDEDGKPIALNPSGAAVGDYPWVIDDPEAVARVAASDPTVADQDVLSGDAVADQNSVWASILTFIRDFWKNLLNAIISGVRSVLVYIFVPPENEIKEVFFPIKNQIESTFDVRFVDVTTLFGDALAPQDLYLDWTFCGVPVHWKIVDMSFLIAAVERFRSLIRGLLTFWLVLFNINQFFTLIGAGDLALGHAVDVQAERNKEPIGFHLN